MKKFKHKASTICHNGHKDIISIPLYLNTWISFERCQSKLMSRLRIQLLPLYLRKSEPLVSYGKSEPLQPFTHYPKIGIQAYLLQDYFTTSGGCQVVKRVLASSNTIITEIAVARIYRPFKTKF
jgi:hypothetical protein